MVSRTGHLLVPESGADCQDTVLEYNCHQELHKTSALLDLCTHQDSGYLEN